MIAFRSPASLKGMRVTVLGIGLNGGGADTIRFVAAHGAHVVATDLRTREQLAKTLDALRDVKNVTYVLGQHRSEDFTRADLIIKTPGVQWNNQHIRLAKDHGVPVTVDAALFFLWCRRPVIGITGSKGKTTVTHMIDHILTLARKNPVLVGAGQTPVLGRLAAMSSTATAVFELSSWRLAGTKRVERSPHIAVATNILADHGDYYRTRDAYVADKIAITRFQTAGDWLVINDDDPILTTWGAQTAARVVRCSTTCQPDERHAVFLRNGIVCERNDDLEMELFIAADMLLPGVHNLANMMLAAAAARTMDIPARVIRDAARTFGGVPHRMEIVSDCDGITYVNDTAATIPDAAIATIEACTRPIVLIAGGADKKLDFRLFASTIATRVKEIVLLPGTATDKILHALAAYPGAPRPLIVDDMDAAVTAARQCAVSGDLVVLSPGAASFGLFANEFVRGDAFRDAVVKRTRRKS